MALKRREKGESSNAQQQRRRQGNPPPPPPNPHGIELRDDDQRESFRYTHRVMANTIFGRGDSDGAVRQAELYFLWAMIHRIHIDIRFWMLKHMMKVALADKGAIMIGGLSQH